MKDYNEKSEIKIYSGELKKVRKLWGRAGDLEITVGEETFYKRTWKGDNLKIRKEYKKRLKKLGRGKTKPVITIYYLEENLRMTDHVAEKMFAPLWGSWGIPKSHKSIVKIVYEHK